ncbi:hypothetical protein CEXT_520391, partial [Caerostris extrusa]
YALLVWLPATFEHPRAKGEGHREGISEFDRLHLLQPQRSRLPSLRATKHGFRREGTSDIRLCLSLQTLPPGEFIQINIMRGPGVLPREQSLSCSRAAHIQALKDHVPASSSISSCLICPRMMSCPRRSRSI